MPSFSRSLEKALHRALSFAAERRQEFATLEHLLLSLTEDKDAIAVMKACGVDIDELRDDLTDYIDNELSNLVSDAATDTFVVRNGKIVASAQGIKGVDVVKNELGKQFAKK